MEPFANPHAVDIIELARRREPGKLFWITTNGSYLTDDVVSRLAALKPLMFKLSLNVSDPEMNRRLMGTGRRTEDAIRAPQQLREHGLAFIGSIVAWPSLSFDTIRETAHYLEAHQAYAVRVRLPLVHRYGREPLGCDPVAYWERVSDFARELRTRLSVPLIVEPPVFGGTPIVPEVDGVVLNSPAYHAGVRGGRRRPLGERGTGRHALAVVRAARTVPPRASPRGGSSR